MPLLPYCVFLSDSNELPRTGVQDRDLVRLDVDRLSVIYSDLGKEEIAGDRFKIAALKFHEVVHAVFEQRAVIPFRFPTFIIQEELRGHVHKELEPYANFLRVHADDVQMEVRIWRTEVPRTVMEEARSFVDDVETAAQSNPAGGTEYMKRLLELQKPLRQAAREVQRISEHLVYEWKTEESRDWVRVFALIPRKHIDDFRGKVSQRVLEPARTHMRVTGPWPATQFFPGTSAPIPHNVVTLTRGETS